MAALHSLESLEALYADLVALSENKLSSLERLGAQLDAHLGDFKNLLDKKPRNEQSRKSLASGKLDISGAEYTINEEFQQGALQLADELDLDELDAAAIFLEAQAETDASGRPALTNSIIRFHQRRKCVLDCISLLLQLSADVNRDEQLRADLQGIVNGIVVNGIAEPRETQLRYAQRCLSSMSDIKAWLQRLAEKLSGASVLGQLQQAELLVIVEYQRNSLVKQHESLAVILLYLIKESHTLIADFEQVLEIMRKADKYDNLLVHYFPPLAAFISRFGGVDGNFNDARVLNEKVFRQDDEKPWTLPFVHAAFRAWWLAEYSGWCGENHDSAVPESEIQSESSQRAQQFEAALKDGAFDFILSLSADVKPTEWYDPARHGLRQYLQRKAPVLMSDSVPFSDVFQEVLMEVLETFVESFITNLPDALRKLRQDEDEQRQVSPSHEHDPDLEKFVVIISYAYDDRPKAALEGFWDAPDGALIGFVHWTSRRASTPLVSAFCEMLQAISADDECATAAHHFLLDEGAQPSGKIRRTTSLTWTQIFKELTYYSSRIRDVPAVTQGQTYRPGKPQADPFELEPEVPIMLECYLRLITRLCSESTEARTFLAQHQTFHITELLFQLASSAIPSRLRACAFTTLRSLLTQKTKEAGEYLWTALDVWLSGGYSPGSAMPKASSSLLMTTTAASMGGILKGLASGFEEPNAFVKLLHALVAPYHDDTGLSDDLPFPENLGISTRQPGIDPYIDFVLGQIFGPRASEDDEPIQQRLLQLSCLDFIATCLDTFNEDLVIFASQSNIVVDAAIKASSLQSYVLLHPFARVMEWMFNDKVMAALFAAVHQDPADVARAEPDSPMILCLLRGIHVINSILELQPTYLDIIRPLIRSIPNYRRISISNAAFGSFEDGVVNHLVIFSDLGRYCGSGHSELVLASLKLLEKLSTSPKLSPSPSSGPGRGSDKNKALAALDDDAETISKFLRSELESPLDINLGADSLPTYIIKVQILDFLNACLRAAPGQPTIAHLLLGFRCDKNSLSTSANGSFSRSVSLFHAVLNMVLNMPMSQDGLHNSLWLVTLNYKALQVLKQLWSSPISSLLTMTEMQAHDAFSLLFVKETIVAPEILWEGLSVADPAFASSPSATCLSDFLGRRSLVLQYLSAQLRQVARSHSPSLKERMFETLLGSTTLDDGEKVEHFTIFDMFDFMENEFATPPKPSQLTWFKDVDVHACLEEFDDLSSAYDLAKAEELLLLRRAELIHSKRLENEQDKAIVNNDAQELLQFMAQDNQIKVLNKSRVNVLHSWVQLTLLMIETGDFDGTARISFVLRCLQTIMPRIESDLDAGSEAIELARLAKALIFSLDFGSDSFKQGDIGDLVSDRLFHLFQVSLRAIITLGAKVKLKAMYYDISYRYLAGMSDVTGMSGIHRRHNIQTIKAAGERLIEVVCDDAHAGEPTCRIAAILVLGALVKLGRQENSKYMIESLARLNFVGILVDSIQHMSNDLHETSVEDIGMQLSYCHAKLALLLQVSQTRLGAVAVLNSGLFHSVKNSGLFTTDPDLGVDIVGPDAVNKHYQLLVAIMRVVCAAVLSRGSQNQQTLEHGRKFLSENRLSILAVLKKSAGLGNASGTSQQSIDDLSSSLMLLMTVTGFLDFEEQTHEKKQAKVFTAFA